jgi:hypothetical protein
LNGRSGCQTKLTVSSFSGTATPSPKKTYPLIYSLTICEIELSKEVPVLDL